MSTIEQISAVVNKNISEIEKVLNASSQYISIGVGEQRVLQFLPQEGITQVEKTYNNQKVKKIRFIVNDPKMGSNIEMYFDVGKRSARLILGKLKEEHTLLKIERIGAAKDTLYIPTEVKTIN